MTEMERYLLDIHGYLVIQSALNQEELAALNALFDEQQAKLPDPNTPRGRYMPLLHWGKPYRDLIDHPAVVPYLEEVLDVGFRLDHEYAEHMISDGAGELHCNGTPHSTMYYYDAQDGRIRCGLIALVWALRDVPPGTGGFCCIPGSHKSSFSPPAGLTCVGTPSDCVQQVPCRAGDVILFTEALRHGTLAWTAPTQRRTLFYKYSPSYLAWWGTYYDAGAFDYTERQKKILRPPYISRMEEDKQVGR
ncbi:MAG: phytanoyl-CoA dioxygenase family protein [Candidatus Latescibacteria bacterium]|nr:phytanoyl-CoA dioxygenase family protein [Candidatus Latescibacterota bacterium]